jgi:hypothetical protein
MSDKEEIVLADIPHPALKINRSRKIIAVNSYDHAIYDRS